MHATEPNGRLTRIPDCYILIGNMTIFLDNLPDLGDSKGASYNDEPVPGRSSPITTYSHSDKRTVSCSINLFVQNAEDPKKNLFILQVIRAAVYPRQKGLQSFPPLVCQIKCGMLLSQRPLCCVLRSYSVKFPQDVPWDEETLCPYRLEVSMEFDIVYSSTNLPGHDKVLQDVRVPPGYEYVLRDA